MRTGNMFASLAAIGGVVFVASLLVACSGGEDRPGSGSISGSGSGTGVGIGSGVVEDKPDGATQVDVLLSEWAITPSETSVRAGEIYFLVENAGPDDAHEFVVIRTDEAPDALPVVEGRVPEGDVDLVDEIRPYTPGSSASITLDLEPGKYVFICNIAEVEGGELESHYELGMRVGFEVVE
ncbi:MAG: hypothetical protein KC482_04500 [Dehalococcoidia bacterium]|nr:hypothetical protein [Dehalococcoidia bacterium]MCA9852844.1 hypothetical protein [Dehalococcoidia bacterium]